MGTGYSSTTDLLDKCLERFVHDGLVQAKLPIGELQQLSRETGLTSTYRSGSYRRWYHLPFVCATDHLPFVCATDRRRAHI